MSEEWDYLMGPVTESFFSFFERLDDESQDLIKQNSVMQKREQGDVLIRQDEDSDKVYVIERGRVEVSVEVPDAKFNPPLTYLGKGDFIGDIGVLTESMRTATVKAGTPVQVLEIKGEAFKDLMLKIPGLAAFIARRLARKVTHTTSNVSYNSSCTDLSGKLPEFDLISVFYTVCSGGGTGELRVLSDRKDDLGMFFFRDGQINKASFRHLWGQEACRQLFAEGQLKGAFSYRKIDEPSVAFPKEASLQLSIDDLLMDGALMRDRLEGMPEWLKDLKGSILISYLPSEFESDEEQDNATLIHSLCADGAAPLLDLWVKTGLSHVPFASALLALERMKVLVYEPPADQLAL